MTLKVTDINYILNTAQNLIHIISNPHKIPKGIYNYSYLADENLDQRI